MLIGGKKALWRTRGQPWLLLLPTLNDFGCFPLIMQKLPCDAFYKMDLSNHLRGDQVNTFVHNKTQHTRNTCLSYHFITMVLSLDGILQKSEVGGIITLVLGNTTLPNFVSSDPNSIKNMAFPNI